MARIKLIVTGDMEKHGLHTSLSRMFPSQLGNGDSVIWDLPQKTHCATSHRLTAGRAPSEPMLSLARAMLAEVGIGKKGPPADLVIVIDDLELENVEQEHVVAEHFRAAVTSVLGTFNLATQQRYRGLLREKCSFHLMKPMAESYFFGDTGALQNAGVPPAIVPRLLHPTDVEAFATDDPSWLPTCQTENARRQGKKPWWRHECHPKNYLNHLGKRELPSYEYEETNHGKQALTGLNWQQVPKVPGDTPILRAFMEDLADWFGVANPLGVGALDPRFYPAAAVRRNQLLLRNM